MAEFPDRLFLGLFFCQIDTRLDEDAGTCFQVLQKLVRLAAADSADVRIFSAELIQQVENFVVGQSLDSAPTHLVGEVFELGDGLIFFNGLVEPRIPVEQHGDRFGIELGSAIGEFADLAFHQGQRRQQHGIAGKPLDAVAGVQGIEQFLNTFGFFREQADVAR